MPKVSVILDSEMDEGSPPTQSLFERLRDNPKSVYTRDCEILISPTTGNGTYVVPDNVTRIFVLIIGGGAGGGSGDGANGGGGGSSGCVKYTYMNTTPGASFTYTIGAGGASGAAGGSTVFNGFSCDASAPGTTTNGGSVADAWSCDGGNAGFDASFFPSVMHGERGTGDTGGGGAPCGIPIPMDTNLLGNGGDGGASGAVGGSASNFGAGGGGGGLNKVGGNGAQGIIFVQPIQYSG